MNSSYVNLDTRINVTTEISLAARVFNADLNPTILFLHAGGEDKSVWLNISDSIKEMKYRTIAIDFRGHGKSDWSKKYGIDDLIGDTVSVISQIRGEPLVVVGSSIGAVVAAIIGGEKIEKIDGLVMLDTPTRLPTMDHPSREVEKIIQARNKGISSAKDVDPRFLDGHFLLDVAKQHGRLANATRRVEIPVLLVKGDASDYLNEETIVEAKQDIPHLEFATLPTGHLVARGCPEGVTDLLKKFLTKHWSNQ
jgi:pimeloyl-ACP methyl ester carboxylesterase